VKECPLCRACADDEAETCPQDAARLLPTIPGPTLLDGKYRLERRLGEGGMGVVFRARHLGLHRPFALKILLETDEHFVGRFRLEAAALGRLEHPNIVNVTDFGVDEDRRIAYLVMELLEGTTLADRCKAPEGVPRAQAVTTLEQIASAVDFAHQRGILHRDLKPANVMLVGGPGGETVKILDFGLAQFVEAAPRHAVAPDDMVAAAARAAFGDAEATTAVAATSGDRSFVDARRGFVEVQRSERRILMGTDGYMAPELFRFEPATKASDLFALGVIAYQLLAGSMPSAGRSDGAPAPPSAVRPGCPPEMDEPVMKLLARSPGHRPATASAAAAAIRTAHRAATRREWETAERPRRRAAAGLCAIAAAALGLLWAAPPIDSLERRAIDSRFGMLALRAPDPRLLVVSLDDRSVDADPRPLSIRADEMGSTLARVFDAGARAVGVDLLLPETWARSGPFAQLLARHAERITLAAFTTPAGAVVGPEGLPAVVGELIGLEPARSLFGFVNLDTDGDGVSRRMRLGFPDADGRERPAWAARVAFTAGALPQADRRAAWIDYSADPQRIQRLAWIDLPAALERTPDLFEERIVLVGAEYAAAGDDDHRVPGRGAAVSGLMLQALAVNTLLAGMPVREAPAWPAMLMGGALGGAVAYLMLMHRSPLRAVAAAAVAAASIVAAAYAMFAFDLTFLRIAGPVVSLLAALALSLVPRIRWTAPPERS
jgi:serine/threonine protein kinase